MKEKSKDFKCHKCRKKCEELVQFGPYHKLEDDNWYCEDCIKKLENGETSLLDKLRKMK